MANSANRRLYFQPLYDHLVSVVGESRLARVETVLEFGSGAAGFIDLYQREGQQAIAVDVWDYSGDYPDSVRFVVSDGLRIDVPDESVDLLVSHSVAEHLDDVPTSFRELDRVLKLGGIAYITVSPLYYSPTGSHVRSKPDWEHVNPAAEGDFFMTRSPLGDRPGAHLNQYTLSDFLGEFGRLPWNFLSLVRKHVGQAPPDHVAIDRDPLDLVTREFGLVAQKMGRMPATASGSEHATS